MHFYLQFLTEIHGYIWDYIKQKKFILMYNVIDNLRMIFTKDRMARGCHITHILYKPRKSFLSNNWAWAAILCSQNTMRRLLLLRFPYLKLRYFFHLTHFYSVVKKYPSTDVPSGYLTFCLKWKEHSKKNWQNPVLRLPEVFSPGG